MISFNWGLLVISVTDHKEQGWGCSSVVQGWPSKLEALGLTLITGKKRKIEEKKAKNNAC
jgi:hypothetical protein